MPRCVHVSLFFRSLESSTSLDLIMPGSRVRNMYVTSEGALKIEAPKVENSGR